MRQLKNILFLGLVGSTLTLVMAAPLAARERRSKIGDWENLKQLLPGEYIRVVLNDTKFCRGKLRAVSDEAIVVRLITGEQTFPRQNVLRVSSKGPSHRDRNMVIGTGVGAGIGAGVFAAAASGLGIGTGTAALFGLFYGASEGTVVGHALPTGRWRDVYRAQ